MALITSRLRLVWMATVCGKRKTRHRRFKKDTERLEKRSDPHTRMTAHGQQDGCQGAPMNKAKPKTEPVSAPKLPAGLIPQSEGYAA